MKLFFCEYYNIIILSKLKRGGYVHESVERERKYNKDTLRADLCSTLILKILSGEERYAYDLIQDIEHKFGDLLNFHRGTIYPTLYRMEAEGIIIGKKVTVEGMRRERVYYRLTPKGETELEKLSGKYVSLAKLLIEVLEDDHADISAMRDAK